MNILYSLLALLAFNLQALSQDPGEMYDHKKYRSGYYIDTTGNRYDGLIRLHRARLSIKMVSGHFRFKKSKKDGHKMIKSEAIKTVVVGQDSLVVFRDLIFNDNATRHFDYNMVKVVDTGYYNLYYYEASSYHELPYVFFVTKGNSKTKIYLSGTRSGSPNFKRILRDYPDLLSKYESSRNREWVQIRVQLIKEINKRNRED